MSEIVKVEKDVGLITPLPELEMEFDLIDPNERFSDNTIEAYTRDCSLFCSWLIGGELPNTANGKKRQFTLVEMGKILTTHLITSKTIVRYLQVYGFQYKYSTIQRKVAAINWSLKETSKELVTKSHEVKTVLQTLKKLQSQYRTNRLSKEDIRKKGFHPPEKRATHFVRKPAEPLRLKDLNSIIDRLESRRKTCQINGTSQNNAIRLKAMFLVWWHGAFRISELSEVRIEDLNFTEQGLIIHLPISKTDQFGEGLWKAIPYSKNKEKCPVLALKSLILALKNPETGYIFVKVKKNGDFDNKQRKLASRSLTALLKANTCNIGNGNLKVSGHSPRRGYVSEAWAAGARGEDIKHQGGWVSSVWERYIDRSDLFENHPSSFFK
jgi:integrase